MNRRVFALWWRGARQQPARALVVLLTLVVMTVATVGALVAGNSLEQLFVQDAKAQWADVDVEVRQPQDVVFSLSRARLIGVETGPSAVAWSPRLILPAVLRAGQLTQPDGMVLGLSPEDQSFPELSAVEGSADWLLLSADEVLLNARAAQRLGLHVGDEIELFVAVPQLLIRNERDDRIEQTRRPTSATASFRVAGVVENANVADLYRTPNVIMRLDRFQSVVNLRGLVNVVHFAASDDSPEAARDLRRQVDRTARVFDMDTDPVLQDQLAIADDEGGQFSSILMTLAILVIIAAGVAATQMLTALAEDRSGEIAVLRTLGVTRRTVRRLVALEASAYAVLAALLGSWLALPVADRIARTLSDHFAELSAGRGREQAVLDPTHDPATIFVGVVIVLATAALAGRTAGRRLADVDVDVLLRGPIEQLPARPLSAQRPQVLAFTGALVLGMGLLGGPASDALRFLGLTLLGTAWWTSLRRTSIDLEKLDERFAWAALAWSTVGAGLLADFSQGFETGFGILVVAGILAVSASAGLLVPRFRSVMSIARLYVPRGAWQVALRTAGAYAQEAAGRTARLHATFGIVLFLAAALHVLGNAQSLPVSRQSGGFDVIATSVVGLDAPQVRRVDGLDELVILPSTVVPEDAFGSQPRGQDEAPIVRLRYPVRLAAASLDFPAIQNFGLADAVGGLETARQALEEVVASTDKVVVDRYALPSGAQVGDDIVIDLGGELRRYELIAVLDTFLLDAAIINSDEFHRLASSSGPNWVLATAGAGVQPDELLKNLEADQRDRGLTGDTVTDAARDVVAVNRTFTDVFALMLLLGLAVAVVAVAATLARSARERTGVLAVLRVIGLPRWALALTLAAEPIVVAMTASVSGLLVGLAVLRVLFFVGFAELAFVVDVPLVVAATGILASLLAVTCLVTAWPSSRVHPAEHT